MEKWRDLFRRKASEKASKKSEKEIPKSEEELPPNVKLVETEKGKFRIAYGTHFTERNPEELGKSVAWLPETATRIDYTEPKELVEKNFNTVLKKREPFSTEYRKTFKEAERKRTPIFLVDIAEAEAVTLIQAYLHGVEPAVGVALLAKLAWDSVIEEKKISRRDFLKKTFAGIYFLSETPNLIINNLLSIGEVPDEKSARRAVDRFLNDLDETAHPEKNSIIVTLRNHLFAQKAETIAKTLSPEIKTEKPEIAITLGARHHGIEGAFSKKDEERAWLIDVISSVPGMEKTREKIATVARFDFNEKENKWEMTERFEDELLTGIKK